MDCSGHSGPHPGFLFKANPPILSCLEYCCRGPHPMLLHPKVELKCLLLCLILAHLQRARPASWLSVGSAEASITATLLVCFCPQSILPSYLPYGLTFQEHFTINCGPQRSKSSFFLGNPIFSKHLGKLAQGNSPDTHLPCCVMEAVSQRRQQCS